MPFSPRRVPLPNPSELKKVDEADAIACSEEATRLSKEERKAKKLAKIFKDVLPTPKELEETHAKEEPDEVAPEKVAKVLKKKKKAKAMIAGAEEEGAVV